MAADLVFKIVSEEGPPKLAFSFQPSLSPAMLVLEGRLDIEQAARAITGRLVRQLLARSQFHRTLIWAGSSAHGVERGDPLSRDTHWSGFGCGVGQSRATIDMLKLKLPLAIAIPN